MQLTKGAGNCQEERSEEKRGDWALVVFSDWLQHQVCPQGQWRRSSSALCRALALPPQSTRLPTPANAGARLQPTSQGSLGVGREAAPPHLLESLSAAEKQIHLKLACYMEEREEHPVFMLGPHPAPLGRSCQYLEHRLRLGALLGHVHLGPATPLVVPDALGHLRGLQPLKSVAVGAAPLIDIL